MKLKHLAPLGLAILAIAVLAATLTTPFEKVPSQRMTVSLNHPSTIAVASSVPRASTATARHVYIVQYDEKPWARQAEAALVREGQSQTKSTRADNDRRDSANRFSTVWKANSDQRWKNISAQFNRTAKPLREFPLTLGGVAVSLTESEAMQLAMQPGIKRVSRELIYTPAMEITPALVGASEVWAGRTNLAANQGKGVTIGFVDTGVTPGNISTTPTTAEAADYPAVTKLGLCVTSGLCNNKLIGMYDFTTGAGFAETDDGKDVRNHGTGVVDIAAGRLRTWGSLSISGIAPKARIVSYKACENTAGCPSGAVVAAIEQAVRDGVPILNLSLSGADQNPWTDAIAQALLSARQAGIVPVVAMGNKGPGAATVGSPASAPWVLGVGATTTTRIGYTYTYNPALADVLASFSSRGPSLLQASVGKPDLGAPGAAILQSGITGYVFGNGTSAAAPHVAGAAALLLASQPTWSTDRVMSQLSTGVATTVKRDDGLAASGFETGGGRLSLPKAADQGVYFVVNDLNGQTSYAGANPALGGNPRLLNRPNLVHEDCQGLCSLQRTVTDGAGGGAWRAVIEGPSDVPVTVSPASFTLGAGEAQSLKFTFTSKTGDAFLPGWVFGRISLIRTDKVAAPVILPWSINLTKAYLPAVALAPMALVKGVPVSVTLAPGQAVQTFTDYTTSTQTTMINVVAAATAKAELRVGPVGAEVASTSDASKTVTLAAGISEKFSLSKPGRYIVTLTNTDSATQTMVISVETYQYITLPDTPRY